MPTTAINLVANFTCIHQSNRRLHKHITYPNPIGSTIRSTNLTRIFADPISTTRPTELIPIQIWNAAIPIWPFQIHLLATDSVFNFWNFCAMHEVGEWFIWVRCPNYWFSNLATKGQPSSTCFLKLEYVFSLTRGEWWRTWRHLRRVILVVLFSYISFYFFIRLYFLYVRHE